MPNVRLRARSSLSRPRRRWERRKLKFRTRSRNISGDTVSAHDAADSDATDFTAEYDSDTSDEARRDFTFFPNDAHSGGLSELELGAALGNIPIVRQRLLRSGYLRDRAEPAFRAATATGQVDVLRVLLQERPARLSEPDFLNKALLVAAQSNQPQSVRFLCERLAERGAGNLSSWAEALTTAASSGDIETVLALLDAEFAIPSPTLISGLASAIRRAAAASHSTVVQVLWNWIFDGTTKNLRNAPSMPGREEATADSSLHGRCLRGEGKLGPNDADQGEQVSAPLGELLIAGLRSEDVCAAESVLLMMERQNLQVGSIMSAFASACRGGACALEPL